jgi:hypothetical protein
MPERGRKSGPTVPIFGQRPFDAAVAALAAAQQGVLELGQLVDLGITVSGIRKRAAACRLHRVHDGVCSLVPPALLTREGRYMAAVLACGPGAVLSHRSAAALHELRATDRTRIEVTVPGRSGRQRQGIQIHRSTTLTPGDTTKVQNIPCTSVARTQLDIADVLSRREVERAFDQAEVSGVFDLNRLHDQLARNPTRPGVAVIKAILAEHRAGQTATWSWLEEAMLSLTREAGIPDPEVNHFIVLDDGEPAIRADFYWRAQGVAVETDGHKSHRTRWAFENDRRRDQRLVAAGIRLIRTTSLQLQRERPRLQKVLRELLGL